jgi:hypothetical protein
MYDASNTAPCTDAAKCLRVRKDAFLANAKQSSSQPFNALRQISHPKQLYSFRTMSVHAAK